MRYELNITFDEFYKNFIEFINSEKGISFIREINPASNFLENPERQNENRAYRDVLSIYLNYLFLNNDKTLKIIK